MRKCARASNSYGYGGRNRYVVASTLHRLRGYVCARIRSDRNELSHTTYGIAYPFDCRKTTLGLGAGGSSQPESSKSKVHSIPPILSSDRSPDNFRLNIELHCTADSGFYCR